MIKRISLLGSLAFLALAAATQAQTVHCNLEGSPYVNQVCTASGILDADGFTVNISPMVGSSSQPSTYIIQTAPGNLNGQNSDTKITNSAGTLLADDELGSGFDRIICYYGSGFPACPTTVKVLPFSSPDNQPVRLIVNRLNN